MARSGEEDGTGGWRTLVELSISVLAFEARRAASNLWRIRLQMPWLLFEYLVRGGLNSLERNPSCFAMLPESTAYMKEGCHVVISQQNGIGTVDVSDKIDEVHHGGKTHPCSCPLEASQPIYSTPAEQMANKGRGYASKRRGCVAAREHRAKQTSFHQSLWTPASPLKHASMHRGSAVGI